MMQQHGAPPSQMATPAATVFTLGDTAKQLEVSDVAVKRLIAKGQLSATQLGQSCRVCKESIEDYIRRGALDLRLPDVRGNWFDDRPLFDAGSNFVQAVKDVAQSQQLSAQLAETLTKGGAFAYRHALQATPEIRAVATRPVHGLSMTWAQSFFAWQMRRHAKAAFTLPSLDRLYQDAAAFNRLMSDVLAKAMSAKVDFSEQYETKLRGKFATVEYHLALGDLTSVDELIGIRDRIF